MVVRGPSPHLRPDPTAFLVREHLGLPQEPQRKNSRSLGVSSRGCTMPASGGRRCWGRAGRSWSYQTPASHSPTVWLEVMALVASTCGYNSGAIEQRVAQECTAHSRRSGPENPFFIVVEQCGHPTGFVEQMLSSCAGGHPGAAPRCRKSPDSRQRAAASTQVQQGPRRDEKDQIAGDASSAHAGPRRAWCVGCRAGVSRAMLSPGREGAAVQDSAACVMDGPLRRGMP